MIGLRTDRLLLAPLRGADLPELHAHWIEPDVLRYLWDGRAVALGEVREIIDASDRLFAQHGLGLWAVRRSGSPALIGCAGFWYFHEPPELELILSLSRRCWGRGLGRECAGALLDHVFDALGWEAVQGSTDAPNAASLKLMRGLGMRPWGERPGEFGTIEVFRITAEEWRSRRESGPADGSPRVPAPPPSPGA